MLQLFDPLFIWCYNLSEKGKRTRLRCRHGSRDSLGHFDVDADQVDWMILVDQLVSKVSFLGDGLLGAEARMDSTFISWRRDDIGPRRGLYLAWAFFFWWLFGWGLIGGRRPNARTEPGAVWRPLG